MPSFEEYAILTDTHWLYEAKAYDLALEVLETRSALSHIYLGGDILEVESLSRHLKHPRGRKLFLDEIEYANVRLDELCGKFDGLGITWFEGNHCYRLQRFLMEHAPMLWELPGLSMPELLRLRERGIEWVPYAVRQLERIGKSRLWFRHEPVGGGRMHAKATAEASNVDVAYGHTHTVQSAAVRRIGGDNSVVTATALPFLGDDRRPIFEYRGPKDGWQRGFSLIQCETSTSDYELRVIIDKGSHDRPRYVLDGVTYGR